MGTQRLRTRWLQATVLAGLLAGGAHVVASDSARGQPAPSGFESPCASALEHALPLPTTVPPAQFVAFEKQILSFLQNGEYRRLGWCRDKGSNGSPVRDTG